MAQEANNVLRVDYIHFFRFPTIPKEKQSTARRVSHHASFTSDVDHYFIIFYHSSIIQIATNDEKEYHSMPMFFGHVSSLSSHTRDGSIRFQLGLTN